MSLSTRIALSGMRAEAWITRGLACLLASHLLFAQSTATGNIALNGTLSVPDHALYFFPFDHISTRISSPLKRSRRERMGATSVTITPPL